MELNTEIASKRLELLHDVIPGVSRFGLMVDSDSSGVSVIADLEPTASVIGLQIEAIVTASTGSAVDAAFAKFRGAEDSGPPRLAEPSVLRSAGTTR